MNIKNLTQPGSSSSGMVTGLSALPNSSPAGAEKSIDETLPGQIRQETPQVPNTVC